MLEAHRPFPKLQFHNQLRLLEAQLDVLWKQKPKSARRWCFPVTQYLFNFTVCIVLWSTYIYQWKDFRWISPPSWLCKKKRFALPSGKLVTTTVHDKRIIFGVKIANMTWTHLYSTFELKNFLCKSACSHPSNGLSAWWPSTSLTFKKTQKYVQSITLIP